MKSSPSIIVNSISMTMISIHQELNYDPDVFAASGSS